MRPKVYLIDGTAVVYRSFYAFIKRPLINSKGLNTSAIFGTINTFLRLVEKFHPDELAIAFDRKEPTFRHQLDPQYKANRPPMPDDLVSQLAPIDRFFEEIGLARVSRAGYEADDVIATVAERCKADHDVILVTSDKDYSQLVDEHVSIFDPFKEVELGPVEIIEKYGLPPESFVDYLALVGDSSDNIPGAMGIGPTTAVKLLQEFNDIDTLYARLDEVKSEGTRKKLEDSRDNVFRSRTLAAIVRDVPLEGVQPEQLRFTPEQLYRAMPFLQEFELSSLAKRVAIYAPQEPDIFMQMEIPLTTEPTSTGFEWKLVGNPGELHAVLTELRAHDPIAIDTETTALDPITAEIVGISLAWNETGGCYLPLGHKMADNLSLPLVLAGLQEALQGKTLIAHNWKFDHAILKHAGWSADHPFFDTMIAAYLTDPGAYQYKLDICAERELGHKMIPIEELIGSGKSQTTFDLTDPQRAAEYSSEDAVMTFRLFKVYAPRLHELGLDPVFHEIELPLVPILEKMERTGVHVNCDVLADISRRTQEQIAILIKDIYALAGSQFNLNSTQQLGKVLFETLGLPTGKKTKTGWSTDNEVLEKLAVDYEIARKLIEYRQLSKLESTYTTALPKLVHPVTGRIHSSFNQTVASTGRLSSSNPNLQNIPVRTPLGREIRRAFDTELPGWSILSADYSQIELRIMALLSHDTNLIAAFQQHEDIHTRTAARVFGVEPEQVTPDERRRAKIINFGIIYGMGANRLSAELEIPLKDAKTFIEQYFEAFPTVQEFLRQQVMTARQNGYAETIFGRKLFLPDLQSHNQRMLGDAERVAVNMPVQGSAADIIKKAMIEVDRRLGDHPGARMLIQVHDELVFEVENSQIESVEKIVNECMTGVLPPPWMGVVPLEVEIGVGKNWNDAH